MNSLPRPAPQAPRYCLSFTAAGLRPELAAVIAGIHLEAGDWARTKATVLERNALQARSASSGKRLESELRQRLQFLTAPQLQLLAKGSSDERSAMAWLAVLKRIQIAADLSRQLLLGKLSGLDPVLRRSDMAAFYEDCERDHPELAALAPSLSRRCDPPCCRCSGMPVSWSARREKGEHLARCNSPSSRRRCRSW